MKITSVNNNLIKETAKLLQKKYREETGLFLLEGEKCIDEAIESGLKIARIFSLENQNKYSSIEQVEVTEAILSKISSTASAPKVIAVGEKQINNWSNNYKKVILLENIKDAGNLGTILRSACAFKIDAVVLYGDTVDLYNPKCVRSSVGNLWKIPVFEIKDISSLKEKFNKYERVATLPKSNHTIWLNDYIPQRNVLIMFGAEADGLSDELKNFATKNVTIEMSGKVESLNLSTSASIIMYKMSLN